MTARPPIFQFDNSYARDLPGFYVAWEGAKVPTPQLVVFNRELAKELGLDSNLLETSEGAEIFAGVRQPDGASPLAQVYAGHQFGGFSPQLGDGRALLLGEIIDSTGNRKDIQLKGSGPTPFSRGGDGKAVVGPVLREYILGEAMHALGIPTTRALAAVTTGETIYRDGPKPGAVLTRVAASHLRVGTFQYFAARGETEKVRQLADYAIARHDPDLAGQPDRYIRLFRGVVERQAALVANWVLVGFVHGVMNTDNTTISGETIDYGPCAFIDAYAVDLASAELGRFPDIYRAAWLNGMRAKLGLVKETAEDQELFETMLSVLQEQSVDYTLFFRHLSEAAIGEPQKLRELFVDPTQIDDWLERWRQRLESEGRAPAETRAAMNLVNPLYVPRNHKVEAALQSAETGEYLLLNELLDVLKAPYEERSGFESYALPAPEAFGPYQTFCGT